MVIKRKEEFLGVCLVVGICLLSITSAFWPLEWAHTIFGKGTGVKYSPGDALVGHYTFQRENVGVLVSEAAISDESSFVNSGHAVNGPIIVEKGIGGKSITFDGVDDYIRIDDAASLRFSGDLTIAFWMNTTSTGLSRIIGKGINNGEFEIWDIPLGNHHLIHFKRFIDDFAFSVTLSDTSTILSNTWHHVAVAIRGTQALLFIDGVLHTTRAQSGTQFSVNSPVLIGGGIPANTPIATDGTALLDNEGEIIVARLLSIDGSPTIITPSNTAFKGMLDDIRLYNRSLSDNEIAALGSATPSFVRVVLVGTSTTSFTTPINLTLQLDTLEVEKIIAVSYYSDGVKIGEANAAPYTSVWNNVPLGTHSIFANVTSFSGEVLTTGSIDITVTSPVTSLPIAQYHFNEPQWSGLSGEVRDSSGFGNHGTAVGGTITINEGIGGRAAYLDGVDDYINLSNYTALNRLNNSFTIAAWVKPSSLTNRPVIFSTRTLNNPGDFQIELGVGSTLGTNRIAVTSYQIWLAETNDNAVVPNAWQHIVYVRSGTAATDQHIYVNGIEQPLRTQSAYTLIPGQNAKLIGAGTLLSVLHHFGGALDEITVYDHALSSTNVMQMYQDQLPLLVLPQTQLKAQYHFNEPQWSGLSGEVRDSSGFGNHGTSSGATIALEGVDGFAGKFNGINNSIVLPNYNYSLLPGGNRSFSISLWFKAANISAVRGYRIFVTPAGPFSGGFRFGLYDNTGSGNSYLGFWTTTTPGTPRPLHINSLVPVRSGEWYHAVVSYNGTDASLYLDGVLQSSRSGDVVSSLNNITLGYSPGTQYYSGALDEVAFYDGPLSASAVADLHAQQRARITALPILHYTFDESGYSGLSGEVRDSSGFGNHGTAVGAQQGGIRTILSGRGGRAAKFYTNTTDLISVGINGSIVAPNSSILGFGPYQDFSFSFWINDTYSPMFVYPTIFTTKLTWNADLGYMLIGDGLSLSSAFGDGTAQTAGPQKYGVRDGQEHHVVLSVNRFGECVLYVDGARAHSTDCSGFAGLSFANGQSLHLGSTRGLASHYNGTLDEFMIFNVALTPQIVGQIYEEQRNQAVFTPATHSTCNDSDVISAFSQGLNYYQAGTFNGVLVHPEDPRRSDACIGSTLRELFCTSEGYGDAILYPCPQGCSNGACIPQKLNERIIASGSLIEVSKALQFEYVFDVAEEEYYGFGDSLDVSLRTPNGLASIILSRDRARDSCQLNTFEGRICTIYYNGTLSASNVGRYYLHSGGTDLFIAYGIPSGFIEGRVISNATFLPWNTLASYDLPAQAVKIFASYNLSNRSQSDITLDVYSEGVSARLAFDRLLRELQRHSISSVSMVRTGNLFNRFYLVRVQERRGDEYLGALWWSKNTTLFYTFTPQGGYSSNLSANDLANGLLGNEIVVREGLNISSFSASSLSLLTAYLAKYPSSVSASTSCVPNWQCTTTPLVCPEYGRQTRECTDLNRCEQRTITEVTCTPNICSGCLSSSAGQCIPYGFRILDSIDAPSYCEITGEIYEQKGDDAACQNNYECFSNECNAGVCTNTHIVTVQSANLLRRIWCRLATLFGSDTDYLACVSSYTGG